MSNPPSRSPPSPGSAWYALGLLMMVFVFSFIDRQILSLLVGPIRRDLGVSDTQVSLLLGPAFAVVYVAMGFPFGRLADTHNRRNLVVVGFVIWSAATLLSGLAHSYKQLLLARMVLAVGEASLAPAAYSLIADYFPERRRATAMAIYAMGIYIGSGLAFMLGGLVVGAVGQQAALQLPLIGTTAPWQQVFLLLGALSLAFVLVVLSLREPPRAVSAVATSWAAVRAFGRRHRRTLLCHNFGFAFMALSGYASSAWLPTYFARIHGWNPGRFALVYGAVILLFCCVGALAGGLWADRLRRRGQVDATIRVGAYAAWASLPLGLLFLLPVAAETAIALMIPSAVLIAMPVGVAAAGLQQLVPADLRGRASAVYLLVVNLLGLGLGPTAVALLTDRLFADPQALGLSLLIVCGGAQLLGALLLTAGIRPFRDSSNQA